MTALSREQAAHFEGLIDAYEQQREDAQQGLKDTLADLREKLAQKIDKTEIAAEVAGLRGAVKRRRMERTAPEKAAKAEEKQDLADQYYFLLQNVDGESTARTHSALGAKPVTPHDPVTGEIEEQAGESPAQESCGSTNDRAGKDQGDGCETLVLEPVGSTPNGAGRIDNPAMGMALRSSEVGNDLPLAGSLSSNQDPHHNVEMPGVQPGPQAKPLPIQVHKTIGGQPLKPAIDYSDVDAVTRQRQADTPDIPAFLKRANTGQAGRV